MDIFGLVFEGTPIGRPPKTFMGGCFGGPPRIQGGSPLFSFQTHTKRDPSKGLPAVSWPWQSDKFCQSCFHVLQSPSETSSSPLKPPPSTKNYMRTPPTKKTNVPAPKLRSSNVRFRRPGGPTRSSRRARKERCSSPASSSSPRRTCPRVGSWVSIPFFWS